MNRKRNTLYCFSPPVMILTMIIEVALAIYALVRFKHTLLRNLAIATFLLLAFFQFAEFQVCANTLGNPELWSRFGYAAITLLPVLGVHVISSISHRHNRQLLIALYSISIAFALFFISTPDAIGMTRCTGRYVLFSLQPAIASMYYLFYSTVLLIGTGLAIVNFRNEKRQNIRHAYIWFVVGSLAFCLPTGIIYILRPSSLDSLPSIMCGFAVLFAFVLGLRVLPLVGKQNTPVRNKTR
ncbi:hypothetical protein H0W80_03450 [Candidatus Saccharibacteria bacterium]|nr:hypothetical protein [Candidatus Saccharibacteria bacterium]